MDTTPTPTELIPFHGDQIQAAREGQRVFVVLKRVCENLGLADNRQAARLKRQPWATTTMMVAVAEDGRERKMFCLDLRSLPMWLATIEASRVRPAIRPKLAAYQVEAADVLAAHFFGHRRGAGPVQDRGDAARGLALLDAVRTLAGVLGEELEQSAGDRRLTTAAVRERLGQTAAGWKKMVQRHPELLRAAIQLGVRKRLWDWGKLQGLLRPAARRR